MAEKDKKKDSPEKKETSKNLSLWSRVFETDTDETYPYPENGKTFTAINPQYTYRKATILWGPCGVRWGFEEVGKEVWNDVWFAKIRLWFEKSLVDPKLEGCAQIVQWGGAEMRNPDGRPNRHAPKSAITDALTKCFSYLGFNADVFMGLHDKPEYVEKLKAKKRATLGQRQQTTPALPQPKNPPKTGEPIPQSPPSQERGTSQNQSLQHPTVQADELPPIDGVTYRIMSDPAQPRCWVEAEGEVKANESILKGIGFGWKRFDQRWHLVKPSATVTQ